MFEDGFNRTGVPELVRIGNSGSVGVPIRPTADGGWLPRLR